MLLCRRVTGHYSLYDANKKALMALDLTAETVDTNDSMATRSGAGLSVPILRNGDTISFPSYYQCRRFLSFEVIT